MVVLETGMGGRLDSTNVIPSPEVAVVTNIGLDHQQFLGPDIRSIAKEKGGIFKDGVPVVLGPMRPEAQSELLAAALRSSSEVHFARDVEEEASTHFGADSSFVTRQNLSTAMAALKVLQANEWSISEEAMASGLADHAQITGQRGRWQEVTVPGWPCVILDGAHNIDGVAAMVRALESKVQSRGGKLWVIWGAVADKDHSEVMALLPEDAFYVWCAADIPRAMEASKVASLRPTLSGAVVERLWKPWSMRWMAQGNTTSFGSVEACLWWAMSSEMHPSGLGWPAQRVIRRGTASFALLRSVEPGGSRTQTVSQSHPCFLGNKKPPQCRGLCGGI